MSKKELILKTLEKMGYSPEVDSDGDIMLCYQMKHIYVMTGDEEEPYVSVMLPQFHEIDEGQETFHTPYRLSCGPPHDDHPGCRQFFFHGCQVQRHARTAVFP
jgi:hypothetical protein